MTGMNFMEHLVLDVTDGQVSAKMSIQFFAELYIESNNKFIYCSKLLYKSGFPSVCVGPPHNLPHQFSTDPTISRRGIWWDIQNSCMFYYETGYLFPSLN